MSWNAATTEQRHQKREKEQQRTSRSGSGAALSSERYFGQILRHDISSRNRVLDVVVADAPCVGVCRSLVLAPHSRLWHVGPIQTSAFVQQAPSCAFGGTSPITFDSTPTTAAFDSGRERLEQESEGVVVYLLITFKMRHCRERRKIDAAEHARGRRRVSSLSRVERRLSKAAPTIFL